MLDHHRIRKPPFPSVDEKPAFTKISAVERVFEKVAFSLAVFHRRSVDGRQNWREKITVLKQKQTRVNGALGTGHAYRVIFENGEPARNGVFGRQNCTF